jgi:PIN domain nuclease of toxin-antitoxin system
MLGIERSGFIPLPLEFSHVMQFGALHAHHGDPFDRMLVAQTISIGARFVTHDDAIRPYGIDVVWT